MAKPAIFISVLAFMLVHIACQAQLMGIKGEGEVISQTITLEDLKGFNLAIAGDVILTQGNTQKIEMEGQKNILENIKHDVKNGVWGIAFNENVRESKHVTIRITLATLEQIGLIGSGEISSTNTFSGLNILDINIAGSGEVHLSYQAQKSEVNLSGSGEAELSGTSKQFSIKLSGSGEVSAADLKTDNCEVHISGSGDASVHASNQLSSFISGSGDVEYSGSPSVNAKISGSGEVTKIN